MNKAALLLATIILAMAAGCDQNGNESEHDDQPNNAPSAPAQ